MEPPETQYAWNGNVALAYQVIGGHGPPDLIYLQGLLSHVDMNWGSPHLSRFLRALASHARLVITDRRGWGCSDRFSPDDVPPLETLSSDLLAVMDSVGSERTAIFAAMDNTLMAAMFAATWPERTEALVLCDPFVTYVATDETPWMWSIEAWEKACEEVRASWGTQAYQWDTVLPDDEAWWLAYQRASIAPGALIAEIHRFIETDVRAVLPSIHVPTLVLQDADATELTPPESGRFVADHIVGARYVEYHSNELQHWYPPAASIIGEIRQFLADVRTEEASFDRVLATVMFTDIVGSTERAAELGDQQWKDLVEQHHRVIRGLLARYRGVEVDTAGDGFFATFDGPARAVECARAIVQAMEPVELQVRAGVHTGEVETIDKKTGGMAVLIGARVCSKAAPSEVMVSQTIKDLTAGSRLVFHDRGEHTLKGVPGLWRLFALGG